MVYNVYTTKSAEADLEGIALYLAHTLGNLQAARRFLDEYEQTVAVLEDLPLSYPRVRDEMLNAMGYHWAPVMSYRLFFTVDEAYREVTIERVLRGSQNWAALL